MLRYSQIKNEANINLYKQFVYFISVSIVDVKLVNFNYITHNQVIIWSYSI